MPKISDLDFPPKTTLFELLDSKAFRHTAMYVGTFHFRDVSSWIRGFEFALLQSYPDKGSGIEGFREWLVMQFDGACNIDWLGLLAEKLGDGKEATTKMFECFELFVKEKDNRGLEAILHNHKQYEIKRYGHVVSEIHREYNNHE